jgi:hypothetical protein
MGIFFENNKIKNCKNIQLNYSEKIGDIVTMFDL